MCRRRIRLRLQGRLKNLPVTVGTFRVVGKRPLQCGMVLQQQIQQGGLRSLVDDGIEKSRQRQGGGIAVCIQFRLGFTQRLRTRQKRGQIETGLEINVVAFGIRMHALGNVRTKFKLRRKTDGILLKPCVQTVFGL